MAGGGRVGGAQRRQGGGGSGLRAGAAHRLVRALQQRAGRHGGRWAPACARGASAPHWRMLPTLAAAL